MTGRKKKNNGGQVTIDEIVLDWHVKSEPQWNTTDGDIGMRLSVSKHDETLTRHGDNKAWRELILEYPFEPPKHTSRFPDRPKIEPQELTADIRLAMEAGWEPWSRGRAFVLVLDEGDLKARKT
jgi:hypothetical protein